MKDLFKKNKKAFYIGGVIALGGLAWYLFRTKSIEYYDNVWCGADNNDCGEILHSFLLGYLKDSARFGLRVCKLSEYIFAQTRSLVETLPDWMQLVQCPPHCLYCFAPIGAGIRGGAPLQSGTNQPDSISLIDL